MKEAVAELRDPFKSQASYVWVDATELDEVYMVSETVLNCYGRGPEFIWSGRKDNLVLVRRGYVTNRCVTEDKLRVIKRWIKTFVQVCYELLLCDLSIVGEQEERSSFVWNLGNGFVCELFIATENKNSINIAYYRKIHFNL